MDFAIPTEGLEASQLIFLMSVYGYILATASNYLAEGAEFLLEALGPSWAGIIGGCLIPMLGVVPDAMMVFMSGLGPMESVVEEITVGTGTLVGSTIMLLTIPTSIGIYLSRRKLGGRQMRALKSEKIREKKFLNTVTGEIETKEITVHVPVVPKSLPLTDPKTWTHVGGTALSTTPKGAKIMMLTSLTYGIIQIPAFLWGSSPDGGVAKEHWFAGIGFVIALSVFLWYLYFTYTDTDSLEVITEKQRDFTERWNIVNGLGNIQRVLKSTADPFLQSESLFELFDSNNSGTIEFSEMCQGWSKIGYQFDDDQARMSFNMLDHNGDGSISRHEFYNWIEDYLLPQYIASQPIQLPPGNIPTNPTVDDILQFYPLPTTLRAQNAERILTFLKNKADRQLILIASKEERYALHIWFSSIQSLHLGSSFHTHSEDLSISPFSSAVTDPESASINSTTSRRSRKPQTSNFPRQLTIDKLEKTSIKSLHNLRPQLRPLVSGVPAWACASTGLITYYKTANDPWDSLYKSIKNIKGNIDLEIFQNFAQKYSLLLRPTQVKFLFYSHDTDMDHELTQDQFRIMLESLVNTHGDDGHSVAFSAVQKNSFGHHLEGKALGGNGKAYSSLASDELDHEHGGDGGDGGDGDDDDDEVEEEDSEHSHLTPQQLIRLAALYIIGGAIVVTIFSDPTVEVIGALGKKCGIPAFYLSFIFTPIFSNSSEIIASLKFAAKKTDVTLGLTLSSLYGACSMNNSCLLAVFLGLIFFRGIPWTATNEVMVMLCVIYIVGILGLKQTLPLWKALIMFMLFPLSIVAIALLNMLN
jgi:Ca2+/Na+ antiporter